MEEVLKDKYIHYRKDRGDMFFLFNSKPRQQLVPDYLSLDKTKVADAKYIPLDERGVAREDSSHATAIYYKTITYMYVFASKEGYLLYPHRNAETPNVFTQNIEGSYGGTVTKLGLRIPSRCHDFNEFSAKIKEAEMVFYNQL